MKLKISSQTERKVQIVINVFLAITSIVSIVIAIVALYTSNRSNIIAEEANAIAKQSNEISLVGTSAKLNMSISDIGSELTICKNEISSSVVYYIYKLRAAKVIVNNSGGLPVSLISVDVGDSEDLWFNREIYWDSYDEWPLNGNHSKPFPIDIEAGKSKLFYMSVVHLVTSKTSLKDFQNYVADKSVFYKKALDPTFSWRFIFGNGQVIESTGRGYDSAFLGLPKEIEDCPPPYNTGY